MPNKPTGVERFYGRWARLYDTIATYTPGVGRLRRAAVDALDLEPGDTVVDVGCGTGANLPYLRRAVGSGGSVVGVDRTPGVLDRARRRIHRAGWTNVHVVRGDAERPPIRRGDAVLASFVVGMLPDPGTAIDAWASMVPEGGRVALLDARPRPTRRTGILDSGFRAFVAVTAPPTARLRYDEPPADVLDRRVEAAREALSLRGVIDQDTAHALGFVRLTCGRV